MGVPQLHAAVNPWHQEEAKRTATDTKINKQMHEKHIDEGLDGVYWLENNGHFLIPIRE